MKAESPDFTDRDAGSSETAAFPIFGTAASGVSRRKFLNVQDELRQALTNLTNEKRGGRQ
jgi:hypothetical protein